MKTLRIMIVAMSILWLNAAYSFTALDLPVEDLDGKRNETPLSFVHAKTASDMVVSDNTNVVIKDLRDTIILDARSFNSAGPFPSASRDCIVKQVPYPDFARNQMVEGGVAVRFMFDDSGNVRVLEACSNSPELENYVVQKMEQLQLKNCVVDVNRDYYLRFMFRLF